MSLLDGRGVVVTGAGDIGAATVLGLIRHGAVVEAWDRDGDALDRLRWAPSDGLERLSVRHVDITDESAVAEAAAEAERALGTVRGLVNTAAVLHLAPVVALALEEWTRTIDVNLTGTFLVCRAMLPALRRGGGAIVNVSSIGGLAGEPELAHYCASKFGVIGFTQSLAREEGAAGVRVNAVCPGAVDSRMNDATLDMYAQRMGVDRGVVLDDVLDQTPLGRLARPDDVADTVVYLLSDLASFVTGESIAVTGGLRY